MMAYLRLPNNGARYGRKRKRETEYCDLFGPFIAWHDEQEGPNQFKPPNNVYCKINRTNNFERSILLRKEREKSQRRGSGAADGAKTKMKHRRINRKRRRPPQSSSNGSSDTKMGNKRIKRQMNSSRSKQNRNDDRLKALMASNPSPTPNTRNKSAMDLWDQINSMPKHMPKPSDDMNATFDSILNEI